MDKYQCKRCQKSFENYKGLRKHVGRIHKIHSTDFYVEYHLDGVWPVCKCGCGEKVAWSAREKRFCELVKGHYSRIHNNWGNNPDALQKSIETRRKRFAAKEISTWNNGLTNESDNRVKENSNRASEAIMSSPSERVRRATQMRQHRADGTIPTLFGKDSSQWKGGVSSVNQIARASTKLYKEWKYPILVRDGFKCTQCPNTKDLHVHHDKETFSEIIKKVMTIDDYEKLEEFDRKKEVAERVIDYHITNKTSGTTLCSTCHNDLHPSLNFL